MTSEENPSDEFFYKSTGVSGYAQIPHLFNKDVIDKMNQKVEDERRKEKEIIDKMSLGLPVFGVGTLPYPGFYEPPEKSILFVICEKENNLIKLTPHGEEPFFAQDMIYLGPQVGRILDYWHKRRPRRKKDD